MKKILLVIGLALLFSFSARAQLMLGGDVSFSHNAREKVTSFTFSPDIGYTLDDFFVGVLLDFGHYRNAEEGTTERNYGITPYVDYSFWSAESLSVFAEAGCSISTVSDGDKPSLLDWTPYLALGLELELAEHWSVELMFATLEYSLYRREASFSVLGNSFSAGLYYSF